MSRTAPPTSFRSRSYAARTALLAAGLLLSLVPGLLSSGGGATVLAADGEPLPGTAPLTIEGDLASHLVDGVDRFLLKKIDASVAARAKHWNRDTASPAAYEKSVEPQRRRLAYILGVRDARPAPAAPQVIAEPQRPARIAQGANYEVFAVRWRAFGDVWGEGLLLAPKSGRPTANVVALPDADQTPEQLCGLAPGVAVESQFARRLAEQGCRVIVPTPVSRERKLRAPPGRAGGANLTNREYVYRAAFEMGRHLIGYETQKVLALVDWLESQPEADDRAVPTLAFGYGEGGLIALAAAAIDTRLDGCGVSGFFGPRERVWEQPIDRNVFGLLEQFGDAELATLVAPRPLTIEAGAGPALDLPGQGGAPAKLTPPTVAEATAEAARAKALVPAFASFLKLTAVEGKFGADETLATLLTSVVPGMKPAPSGPAPQLEGALVDAAERQQRTVYELDRHNQQLLVESPYVRQEFMKQLDTSSVEKYQESVERYRKIFRDDVVGAFDDRPLPFNPRTRLVYDKPKWRGYEVVLDVFPDVIASGVLLLPKDLKPGEKRPVVVCQHGLEGRPKDVLDGDHPAYHDYAAKLAERGFITFAPQNLYIFTDRFRTLQRKANPLKKTLFSVIVPQHQQIVDWLKQHPNVDSERIAFYGLSYGGKSAMRIPPLVPDYCLSICSADFNEWVSKNASTRLPFSYMWTGEYEIFEWDLGGTFNYSEMAALICPRPFMVERGHTDGVSTDDWVSFEFAKVYYLYSHRLKMGDRCEMEVFDGPHTINGKGTFDFLHKHLNWPKPSP